MIHVSMMRTEVLRRADEAWEKGQYALACAFYEHLLAQTESDHGEMAEAEFIHSRLAQYRRALDSAEGASDALRYHQDVERAHHLLVEVQRALPKYAASHRVMAEVANWDVEFRRLDEAVAAGSWQETIACADHILTQYQRNSTATVLKRAATSILNLETWRDRILQAVAELTTPAASQTGEHDPRAALRALLRTATSLIESLRMFDVEAQTLVASLHGRSDVLSVVTRLQATVQEAHDQGVSAMVALLVEQFEAALFASKYESVQFVLRGDARSEGSATGYQGIPAFFADFGYPVPSLGEATRQRYVEVLSALRESLHGVSAEGDVEPPPLKQQDAPLHVELQNFASEFRKLDSALEVAVQAHKVRREWAAALGLLQSPTRILPSRYARAAKWYKQRDAEARKHREKLQEAVAARDLRKQHTLLYNKQNGCDLIPVNELERERHQYLARRKNTLSGLLAAGAVLGFAVLGILYLYFSTRVPS